MGPVVWRKVWQGTEWRVSLLPIGGYVDIPGMAPTEDELGNLQHPTEGFATKSLAAKVWVLSGGVLANYLLAVVLLAVVITAQPNFRQATAGLTPEMYGAQVVGVVEGRPAAELGLQADDVILAINGITDPDPSQVTETIQSTEGELVLTIGRGGEDARHRHAVAPRDDGGTSRPCWEFRSGLWKCPSCPP